MGFLNDILGDTRKRQQKERCSSALNMLLFTGWGVPVRSVEELKEEVKDTGFKVVRVMHSPISQFTLARGMLLSQRETD